MTMFLLFSLTLNQCFARKVAKFKPGAELCKTKEEYLTKRISRIFKSNLPDDKKYKLAISAMIIRAGIRSKNEIPF